VRKYHYRKHAHGRKGKFLRPNKYITGCQTGDTRGIVNENAVPWNMAETQNGQNLEDIIAIMSLAPGKSTLVTGYQSAAQRLRSS
jgi:hypothetical protein